MDQMLHYFHSPGHGLVQETIRCHPPSGVSSDNMIKIGIVSVISSDGNVQPELMYNSICSGTRLGNLQLTPKPCFL